MVVLSGPSKADPPTPNTSVVIISGDGMGIQQRTAIQYAAYGLEERQPMDALPVALTGADALSVLLHERWSWR